MTRPPAERELARRLRAEGWSLREIAAHVGIALGTASEWVRDVDGPVPSSADAPPPGPLVIWRSGALLRCNRCGLLLPVELFNRYRNGRQHWCRRCFLGYHDRNRKAAAERRRERRDRARDFVLDHLVRHPCVDCGETDIVVLEFDHVAAKRDWVTRLMQRGAPLARIQEEMDRCEVVCVNCHRRRSAARGGRRRLGSRFSPSGTRPLRERNLAHLFDALRAGCVDCREDDLVVLDFDHREGKRANVTTLAQHEASLARIQAEIDRCDVRCANCHRRRTAEAGGHLRAKLSAGG